MKIHAHLMVRINQEKWHFLSSICQSRSFKVFLEKFFQLGFLQTQDPRNGRKFGAKLWWSLELSKCSKLKVSFWLMLEVINVKKENFRRRKCYWSFLFFIEKIWWMNTFALFIKMINEMINDVIRLKEEKKRKKKETFWKRNNLGRK